MKFLHVTCISETGIETPATIGIGHIAMIAPCPDGAHGCHIYLPCGMMAVKETMEEVNRCLSGDMMEIPKGMTQ